MRALKRCSSLILQGYNASICTVGSVCSVSAPQMLECDESGYLIYHRWNRALHAIQITVHVLQNPSEPQSNPSIRHPAY